VNCPDYGLFLDDIPPTATYSTIELEKLRIGLQEIISPELLGARLEWRIPDQARRLSDSV
jgi:hypothetical protein